MKTIISVLLFLLSTNILSEELKIESQGRTFPKGESFTVFFKIETESSQEPQITFNPIGLEVLRRESQGVRSRTTFINGKITRSRELIIAYELVGNNKGRASLENIKVRLDGEVLTHPNMKFTIGEESTNSENDDFFLKAIPSKSNVYVGESIILRYYLYKRVQVPNFDIKRYPKLKGFLKRFMQESTRDERVNFNGQIYLRMPLYSAQLFPEDQGELQIDPMTVRVHYPARSNNDPFGGFGIGLGYTRLKKKTIRSKPVKINVKPLPVPADDEIFTGLVGKHEFSFEMTKSKYLVNEPIEARLKVTGSGMLENFEAPKIIESSSAEEFETNADLKINKNFTASKVFDYTYLARRNDEIEQRDLKLSYFDPDSERFVSTVITIPAIKISGGAFAQSSKNPDESVASSKVSNKSQVTQGTDTGIVSPYFEDYSIGFDWIKIFNIFLRISLVSFLGVDFVKNLKLKKMKTIWEANVQDIYDEGLSYSRLFRVLQILKSSQHRSLIEAVQDSSLSKNAQDYFINLLKGLENQSFSNKKVNEDFKIEKKYFKELASHLNKAPKKYGNYSKNLRTV